MDEILTSDSPSSSSSISTTTIPSSQEQQQGHQSPSFLTIPLEIRLQIYAYLLLASSAPASYSHFYTTKIYTPILLASRLTNHEATPILYRHNTFTAHPSLLASFPRLRAAFPPITQPYPVSLIRRFHLTLRLDCDPGFTADAATAAFSGRDALTLHLTQSSFLGVGCANLRLFEGVRGVRRVKIGGSTTGFEAYIAWLEGVMMADKGVDVGVFVEEGPSVVERLAIRFYV